MDAPEVIIDGAREGPRYLITVDSYRVWLQPALFRVVAILGITRRFNKVDDGWVGNEDIGLADPGLVRRYIHRVRLEVNTETPEWYIWEVIENKPREGFYRLATKPRQIKIPTPQNLMDFRDWTVIELWEKYRHK